MESKKEFKTVCAGIPFHKGTEISHLKLSIDSIINQTYPLNEIHLIQDGSVNKEITQMIEKYVNENDNIKHFKLETNRGLAYALNYSILNTESDYYLRMDSDDISLEKRLETLMIEIEKDDTIEILGSSITEFYDETLEKSIKNNSIKELRVPLDKKEIKKAFHYKAPMYHVTVLFKKEVFAEVGLYNSKYRRTQDLELWSRVLKKDINIMNIEKSLVFVRAEHFVESRSSFRSILRQAKIRYKYNTWSPKLNILKISSILFRFLPKKIRVWAYNKLR